MVPEVCDLDHEPTVHYTVRALQVTVRPDLGALQVGHSLGTLTQVMRPRDGQKLVHRQVRPFPGDIETGKETERWTKTGSQTGETIPWGH